MANIVRLALAQINPIVGNLDYNYKKIADTIAKAKAKGANIVAFTELVLTGYPPEDLVLLPSFVQHNLDLTYSLAEESRDIFLVFGFIDLDQDTYNAAAVAYNGKLIYRYHKVFLPNYGVFDEERYFRRGTAAPIFKIGPVSIGVSICEDIWHPVGPANVQAYHGAQLLININGSPFHAQKQRWREAMLATRASDTGCFIAYVNMVGAQDELVFDGSSVVFSPEGELIARAKSFEEDLLIVDLDLDESTRVRLRDTRLRQESEIRLLEDIKAEVMELEGSLNKLNALEIKSRIEKEQEKLEEIYNALVLGTRDYARKNGFSKAVLGLSGGIDSSLSAAIAVDALGPQNVIGVRMPSRFTSQASLDDAKELADNLGIELRDISIEPAFCAFLEMLKQWLPQTGSSVAIENIQPRIRATILWTLSNQEGLLLLTTGNKSEIATGYCTLGGDTTGGFAVIKDIPKTLVYELAAYRNSVAGRNIIPERVFTKPPSAELRENQKDEDSLPPYAVLDQILEEYVEHNKSALDIVKLGIDPAFVSRAIKLVDANEYKRRQSPIGIKITPRAFGKDRRMPVTNHYRGQQNL
jgi:NAD+ synthase (glutamine-hydrolysing)